jgi:hypothetical protein
VARVNAAMDRVARSPRDIMWSALNRLAIYFAQSAEKLAPIGKRRRPVSVAVGSEERRIQGGFKYGVKVFGRSQSNSLARRFGGFGVSTLGTWWWTNDATKARQLSDIWFRGAAKASWAGLLRKLNAKHSIASDMLKKVLLYTNWVRFMRSTAKMSIVLVNKLSYMERVAPGIANKAIQKANARFEAVERKKIEGGIRAAWYGVARRAA